MYSNYIATARLITDKAAQNEFLAGVIWFLEDGVEPDFSSESAAIAYQGIKPSLEKQRQRILAGRKAAKRRTGQRKANEQGNETANEKPTNGEQLRQQTNKLISYQAYKLSSIDNTPIVPYGEIVSYLNEKTGKNFKPTSKATRDKIKARFNEGFTIDDFKAVIDNTAARWANDSKMEPYLRPETLFGTKFEGYLNMKTKGGQDAEFSEYDNVI